MALYYQTFNMKVEAYKRVERDKQKELGVKENLLIEEKPSEEVVQEVKEVSMYAKAGPSENTITDDDTNKANFK